jgi:glycolate oxidase
MGEKPGPDVGALAAALGEGRVLLDPDLVEQYRYDQTSVGEPGHPVAVVQAAGTDDVVATVRWAAERRVPVVARGAGTSLAGGASAIEGCVVLSLAGMDRILEISPAERVAVVEAGVVTAEVDRAARAHGLMYAPDPSSYAISTIGGNLATNAGGLRCLKYGVTRDAALGLEVVTADGRIIRTGRRTAKGVAGYDLTGLFVGSEGTLGIITSAVLRLRPAPPPPVTVAATFGAVAQAAQAVQSVVAAGTDTALLELMDRATLAAMDEWRHTGHGPETGAMLVAQCDGADRQAAAGALGAMCEAAGALEVAVSADEVESEQLVELRRLAFPAIERQGACLVEDVCVPVPRLAEMFELVARAADAHGVRVATVAHAGDGNLHPVFIYERGVREPPPEVWAAADEVFRGALALGGTLTGEHGVGAVKARWLADELGADNHALQRGLKAFFDPLGILNPGRAL